MKWSDELFRELTAFLQGLSGQQGEECDEERGKEGEKASKKAQEKKKPLTIREIGLPRLAVMLAAGMLLLILSFPDFFSPKTDHVTPGAQSSSETGDAWQGQQTGSMSDIDAYVENAEERLRVLLRKVEGVGDVEVMITIKSTGESIPLKDTPYEKNSSREEEDGTSKTEEAERSEEETVMVEAADGSVEPYLVMETVPQIEGVAIIAQGGGSSAIKKEIIEAVQVLFDIKAHKIKVMKMNR